MADVMWCESCRMRVGIDVDCDIADHVHRPIRGDQTGTDGWSKVGDDIVTRLREEALRPAIRAVCTDAADEIERLRAALDRVFSAIEDEGRNPEYHRRIMREHRRQWPTLWNALDALKKEARRG